MRGRGAKDFGALRSLREVGDMLGISHQTVKTIEDLALHRLRRALQRDPVVRQAAADIGVLRQEEVRP